MSAKKRMHAKRYRETPWRNLRHLLFISIHWNPESQLARWVLILAATSLVWLRRRSFRCAQPSASWSAEFHCAGEFCEPHQRAAPTRVSRATADRIVGAADCFPSGRAGIRIPSTAIPCSSQAARQPRGSCSRATGHARRPRMGASSRRCVFRIPIRPSKKTPLAGRPLPSLYSCGRREIHGPAFFSLNSVSSVLSVVKAWGPRLSPTFFLFAPHRFYHLAGYFPTPFSAPMGMRKSLGTNRS